MVGLPMNACTQVIFRFKYCQPKKLFFWTFSDNYSGGQVKVTNSKKSISIHEKN